MCRKLSSLADIYRSQLPNPEPVFMYANRQTLETLLDSRLQQFRCWLWLACLWWLIFICLLFCTMLPVISMPIMFIYTSIQYQCLPHLHYDPAGAKIWIVARNAGPEPETSAVRVLVGEEKLCGNRDTYHLMSDPDFSKQFASDAWVWSIEKDIERTWTKVIDR